MAKFKKGDKAWAARLHCGRAHINEVTITACGEEQAKLERDCPATGHRRQVSVSELHVSEESARAWVAQQADSLAEHHEAEAQKMRVLAVEMRKSPKEALR